MLKDTGDAFIGNFSARKTVKEFKIIFADAAFADKPYHVLAPSIKMS